MKFFFFILDVIITLLAMIVSSFILDWAYIEIPPVFAFVSFLVVLFYGVAKSVYYFMERDSDVSE